MLLFGLKERYWIGCTHPLLFIHHISLKHWEKREREIRMWGMGDFGDKRQRGGEMLWNTRLPLDHLHDYWIICMIMYKQKDTVMQHLYQRWLCKAFILPFVLDFFLSCCRSYSEDAGKHISKGRDTVRKMQHSSRRHHYTLDITVNGEYWSCIMCCCHWIQSKLTSNTAARMACTEIRRELWPDVNTIPCCTAHRMDSNGDGKEEWTEEQWEKWYQLIFLYNTQNLLC